MPQVTAATRIRWMAAGAILVVLIMVVVAMVSSGSIHDTAKACSPDGRICITREQAPGLLQVRPVDRLWVSVDMHDKCGSFYPTPFELPDGRLDATFTAESVELRGLGLERITYPAAGC